MSTGADASSLSFITIQLGMLKNNHILQSENSVAVYPAAGRSDAAQILGLPLIMS